VVPGFSTFAVTGSREIQEQTFEVTDLAVAPSAPLIGERVTVSARVSNTGQAAGTYSATLWIDSEIESTQNVDV